MKALAVSAAIAAASISPAFGQWFPEARRELHSVEDVKRVVDEWSRKSGRVVAAPIETFRITWPSSYTSSNAGEERQTTQGLFDILNRMPTVHLVVTPPVPRDYIVKINGRQYDATERGEYGVVRGPIEISVQRIGKPPCVWKGRVDYGERVECAL